MIFKIIEKFRPESPHIPLRIYFKPYRNYNFRKVEYYEFCNSLSDGAKYA